MLGGNEAEERTRNAGITSIVVVHFSCKRKRRLKIRVVKLIAIPFILSVVLYKLKEMLERDPPFLRRVGVWLPGFSLAVADLGHGPGLRLPLKGSGSRSPALVIGTSCSGAGWDRRWRGRAVVEVRFVVAEVELPGWNVIVVIAVHALVVAFVVEEEHIFWDPVQGFGADWVQAIATLKIPKTVEAFALIVIEVLVWVADGEPGRAEVAEVRVALAAAHVVAAHEFLAGHVAGWAWGGVQLQVLFRSLLFFCQLGGSAGEAVDQFAVPALLAHGAERIFAVLADGQALCHGGKL